MQWKKTTITTDFISEGVATGDINRDGKMDIVAGYFWFEAPDWKRHEIYPSRIFDPKKEYSNSFLNLCMDVNLDGLTDIVLIDFPGNISFWLENPGGKGGDWKRYVIGDSIGIANESPGFVDIDGDGRLDLLCGDLKVRQMIWLQAPVKKGQTNWTRYPVSATNFASADRFAHGLGYGDINKDGKKDIITTAGWFEAPANRKQPNWKFHGGNLGDACSQMQAHDVNGDGNVDVVSASAHKLGIWWYEQIKDASNNIHWKRYTISEAVSQTHSSEMTDLDGDGQADFITGKRYLAHHNNPDPGSFDPPLLLWFQSTPAKAPYWVQHTVDGDSGSGLNIATTDMNKDGRTDIVVANKKGVFLFENLPAQQ